MHTTSGGQTTKIMKFGCECPKFDSVAYLQLASVNEKGWEKSTVLFTNNRNSSRVGVVAVIKVSLFTGMRL